MKILKSLILILLIATSCQYDPFASDMTTHKPSFNEVLGKYKFEKQTIGDDSVNKLASDANIVLNADSTFDATHIPNFVNDKYISLLSLHGKWSMNIIGGVDNGTGTKDEWGITLTGVPVNIQNIGLTGESAPYGLLITYDDPDEGAIMAFKKESGVKTK